MSGKLKKVVMFIRLSILLLLSRPFGPITKVCKKVNTYFSTFFYVSFYPSISDSSAK